MQDIVIVWSVIRGLDTGHCLEIIVRHKQYKEIKMYSRQASVKIYEYVETEGICNDITVSDLTVENVREKREKEKKKNKARVVIHILVCMLTILAFCCGWLIYSSSLYSVLDGYEDLSCASSDSSCISLLCPQGAQWSQETDQSLVHQHFTCCADTNNIFKCFHLAEKETAWACVKYAYEGVLYPGYKKFCREGWLWVHWKRKCLRQKVGLDGWGHKAD